jgi:hypothetical protein
VQGAEVADQSNTGDGGWLNAMTSIHGDQVIQHAVN